MKLNLSQIKSITAGAVRIEEDADGFHLHRFTAEQQEIYKTSPKCNFVYLLFTINFFCHSNKINCRISLAFFLL